MKKILISYLFLVAAMGVSAFFILPSFISRLDAISSNPNPLIRHFSPTWRSLKKIADIPYLFAGIVGSRDPLPRYEIELTKNDLSNLLMDLPSYPEKNRLYESYKQNVKGMFRFGDYETKDAKIRYRGVSPNHWNALKKSIQVNLPSEKPLKERTALRFFIGEDKGWIKGLLWNHLAEKLNLMSPKMEAVELVINKKPMGVYMLVEGWEESFLERYNRPLGRLFSNKNIPATKPDLFLPESAFQWYDRFEEEREGETFLELRYFLWLTAAAPPDVFEKKIEDILDMDIFLRWTLATILSGNFHQGNGANLNFYFNQATGKFEPIVFDAAPSELTNTIDISNHRVVNRLMQNERYRAQFEALARDYVSNPANLADDLAFYDAATNAILPAIYRDSAKVVTSFESKKKIKKDREAYKHNFLALGRMLEEGGPRFTYANESYPLNNERLTENEFASFHAISASRGAFLAANPQFIAGADYSTVILLPGTHTFSRVVIIPRHLKVIIRENSRLLLGPEVSLISYSPVIAYGTAASPITIGPLIFNAPWGVFAVINTETENVFRHVHFSGGKDATVNGLYLSGMLSAHNADIDVRSSIIKEAAADDGIHVLGGKAVIKDSFFQDNNADSIDFDFAKEKSLVVRNIFSLHAKRDTNGDAIDLSFSSLPIEHNIIEACSDKGISAGEFSMPRIEHNIIKGCAYGIAVKDRSEVIISDNTFANNEIAIGLYRKKPHFMEGGRALLQKNIFVDNKINVTADAYSRIMNTSFQE